MSAVPLGDAIALARELVRVDSRNPDLAADAPGERDAARVLAETLRAWGMDTEIRDAAPGRPNVVARVGPQDGPTLLFNGHLDTVGTEGMAHAPFDAHEDGGRLYGRGSADMKGGIAAMCAAAARAAASGDLATGIIVAAVADEEWASIGTRALVAQGLRADSAVVTEPTQLAVMPAHRGFAWIELVVHGRAAHGSRYDIGIDAIRLAALVLAELDMFDREELTRRTHPLLGRGSLHASLIEGGIGMSTYPDRCVVRIERRTLPGETAADAVAEVRRACGAVRERRPEFSADVRLELAQKPSDVAADAPVVRALEGALALEGVRPRLAGMSAWTDAALLNEAGIPAVCFGPGDIGLAHAAEEWVETGEIERAAAVLTRLARDWHKGAR